MFYNTYTHAHIPSVCIQFFYDAYYFLFRIKWTYSVSLVYLPQVNYLHSHGLAHTELRLENLHISPLDRHIKVSTILVLYYLGD